MLVWGAWVLAGSFSLVTLSFILSAIFLEPDNRILIGGIIPGAAIGHWVLSRFGDARLVCDNHPPSPRPLGSGRRSTSFKALLTAILSCLRNV